MEIARDDAVEVARVAALLEVRHLDVIDPRFVEAVCEHRLLDSAVFPEFVHGRGIGIQNGDYRLQRRTEPHGAVLEVPAAPALTLIL